MEQLHQKVARWKYALLKVRQNRVQPGLDDKTLSSWNAILIQGLLDAYRATHETSFLDLAIKNANFLCDQVLADIGKLFHCWKVGKASIDGFLEDYAFLIQAYLSLFELTGEEKWLRVAQLITEYTMNNFYDESSGLFYFSEKNATAVITNHFQKEDNVIPSANSLMAHNLHRLYLICAKPDYLQKVKKMLQYITPHFTKYPMAYANWGSLMLKLCQPYFEVAVCGINANLLLKDLQVGYQPNILWAHAKQPSEIPLLKNRFHLGNDLIYVCRAGVCQLPVNTPEEALVLIQNK
jgi:uncharacterized protein YyaL (SSP411 family)